MLGTTCGKCRIVILAPSWKTVLKGKDTATEKVFTQQMQVLIENLQG